MMSPNRIGLASVFFVQLSLIGFSQSGIIATYVGPGLPVMGAQAITQPIDGPNAVAPDGTGGFYVASSNHNRVYRVAADGRLSLVAGSGSSGFSGDGGPATSAQLNNPSGVAVDTAGNLQIADRGNHRIRKVTPAGIISTVAGNGTSGFSGDGGPAASAQLNEPSGVAVDAAGNLYIGDLHHQRIRKVTPAGIISTVAGNGRLGFSGDGGPAISAQLNQPSGVAVDAAGNLYIGDTSNQRIRKVTPAGTISTVAGTGTYGFSGDGGPATWASLKNPIGVAVDAAGNLYIGDSYNYRIRKVTSDGTINTVAGTGTYGFSGDGGPATWAQLSYPSGIAVDAAGNLYIGDTSNHRIRRVTTDGMISSVCGNGTYGFSGDGGPATSAQLYSPSGVAVDAAGNLYIGDSDNHRIRKVTQDGTISTAAGTGTYGFGGDGGPATSAQLYSPSGVAIDAAGSLYIGDSGNHRIRKIAPAGIISTVAGNETRGFSGDGGLATSAQLNSPSGVAVDAAGSLYIADRNNHRIRKVTPAGIISTVVGNGTLGFSGDGGPATSAQLYFPSGVAVDVAGNLYVVDRENQRIRKVTPAGTISTVAGEGRAGFGGDGGPAASTSLYLPSGVAVDAAGNLYIADTYNQRIRKVAPAGIISTVAGNGIIGFSGDGGPASSAQLNTPSGIAVDAAGDLYIGDTRNNRVRKVSGELRVSLDLVLNAGGAADSSTAGLNGTIQTGYATVAVNTGAAPYGTAVFSFKQNGVTISETGVPASPPTTSARIFIDSRSAVAAVPARTNAGMVDINTGIAVVNRGTASANVAYVLRDVTGAALSNGNGTIAAGAHFSKFINQLKDVAPNFDLPLDFQTTTQLASLEISSDLPLSIVALRMTINQKDEALFTTTPMADLTQPLTNSPIYFPQFADGGGYTTALVLLNTSHAVETGTFQVLDDNGAPLVVNQVGGTADSSFKYSMPSGGAFRFQTDGFPTITKVGWVQLTPDAGTSTPIGAGMFSYNPGNVLFTESGIPSTISTTHARVYVDLSGGHNSGLAIASPAANATITIKAFQSDGVTEIGAGQGPLLLVSKGHVAKFADQFITGLPAGFTGVLDISSATPFAALTLRSLINERNDFLFTTFPIADQNRAAPLPIVFPQLADGGGYVTQFILLSAGAPSSTTLRFYGKDGMPLAVGK